MSEGAYLCERASSAHADELLALFESSGNGCYCGFWYFQGDKNAWLERCYLKPEENRRALVARLSADELCGVVARPVAGATAGSICGWLNVSRSVRLARLYDQRIYKGLPCFEPDAGGGARREAVYAVACNYVAEHARGRGVARALLSCAIEEARRAGGTALEAFPRATPQGERLRPDEIQMGPEALFLAAGFTPVSDFRPYPVLRLHLT
ncbi:MAG TPA: GNAT family N-acetyltransferase [Polyangiaceae bacterium]|nr:GNAT family N-acetyltransferase [Polyangiaceae bacterium]